MSVNKVILVGNVGKDPETRYLNEETAMSKFPLATSETYKNRAGERVSNTEWHNVVLWRGLAQVAEKYVKKGSQIYIEGRIKTRSYDDQDGHKRYITEIVGDQMQLLGRRPDEAGEPGGNQGGQSGQSMQPGQTAQQPDTSGGDAAQSDSSQMNSATADSAQTDGAQETPSQSGGAQTGNTTGSAQGSPSQSGDTQTGNTPGGAQAGAAEADSGNADSLNNGDSEPDDLPF